MTGGAAGALPVPGDALVADLYELTMAAAYHRLELDQPATFELFVRSLPPTRRFLVAAGLEQALDHLASLHVTDADLAYLEGLGTFDAGFLAHLAGLRFTGEVWALPEGTVAFAEEPILRVTAPLVEAQLVETALLALVAHPTMVASKAARVALAAGGRPFVDFAARRTHGVGAAHVGARASYVGGAAGTSLASAGRAFGIPLSGTMAHSYVTRFGDEAAAFRAFARTFPEDASFLIDTFDTVEGARVAARVALELAGEGITIRAVRVDSGDLATLSRRVRDVLDDAGLPAVGIIASGDLDEHRILSLLEGDAPIDSFGVGTQLGTSADAPSLGAVYKLVADADGPKAKTSPGKRTWPGLKQVWRCADKRGVPDHDLLALREEELPGAVPLLERVMVDGRATRRHPPVAEVRATVAGALALLPDPLRRLDPVTVGEEGYRIDVSPGLAALAHRIWAGRG
jgi:nicotinate phosphoribosyltransferase